MTDRELLELAAGAAGLKLVFNYDANLQGPCIIDSEGFPEQWNPLENDGDGARLEAALNMNASWWESFVVVDLTRANYADHGGDRQKARRFAAVHAAAQNEIAKSPRIDPRKFQQSKE
jgi:hypothetical protein